MRRICADEFQRRFGKIALTISLYDLFIIYSHDNEEIYRISLYEEAFLEKFIKNFGHCIKFIIVDQTRLNTNLLASDITAIRYMLQRTNGTLKIYCLIDDKYIFISQYPTF